MLGRAKLLAQEPHLRSDGLLGGGWYYDFLTDDARVTIDTLKGAVEAGAVAANYMEVTGLVRSRGRVAGVEISDRITGETGSIRARQVINSAGPWVDRVRFLEQGVGERLLRPTKEVHVVVRNARLPAQPCDLSALAKGWTGGMADPGAGRRPRLHRHHGHRL